MYHQDPRITTDLSPDQRRHGISRQNVRENGNTRGGRVGSDEIPEARRITRGKDPPGQRCCYIPPGDHRNERYRLTTLASFPARDIINIFDLAESGFYYTGFEGRTTCFSCGTSVERWRVNDSPFDSVWHDINCSMAQGRDLRNIESDFTQFRKMMKRLRTPTANESRNTMLLKSRNPLGAASMHTARDVALMSDSMNRVRINDVLPKLLMAEVLESDHKVLLIQLNLHSEADRRKTFAKWPSYPAPYLPSALAKEGFFYLGNLDRTQCFSCSGVLRNWSPTDDVREQHRKHFPNCRLHVGRDPRNIVLSEAERRDADLADTQKLSSLLPSGDVSAPPDPSPAEQQHLELYLPCDNPLNPHMRTLQARMETFRGWSTSRTKATPEQIARAGMFYLGEADKTKCFYCNGGLQNWDFNDEPWTEHAKWFPGCAFINRQKGTGFVRELFEAHPNLNRPSIRNGISFNEIPQFQESTSHGNCTGETLHETSVTAVEPPLVLACDANAKRQTEGQDDEVQSKRARSNPDEGADLLTALRQKEESLLCKNCKSRRADIVLLPCGHNISCEVCAPSMKKCVHCRKTVSEFIKIYRA